MHLSSYMFQAFSYVSLVFVNEHAHVSYLFATVIFMFSYRVCYMCLFSTCRTCYMPLLIICLYLLDVFTYYMSLLIIYLYLLHVFIYFMPLLISCLIPLCYIGLCDYFVVYVQNTCISLVGICVRLALGYLIAYHILFVIIFP